jgi:hypothetical protein
MADFQPFNLGQVLQTAEAIKAARSQSTTDRLREQYLGEQIQGMRDDRAAKQQEREVVLGKEKAQQVVAKTGQILQASDPKNYVEQFEPDLVKNLTANGVDWATVDDNVVRQMVTAMQNKANQELGVAPLESQSVGGATVLTQGGQYKNSFTPRAASDNTPMSYREQQLAKSDPEYAQYLRERRGQGLSVTLPDGTTISDGGAQPFALPKPAQNKLGEDYTNALAGMQRLQGIVASVKPEYLTWAGQAKGAWQGVKAKAGMNLAPEERQNLQGYQTWRSDTLNNLNLYIKEVTGAAMSEAEAKRIQAVMPSTDDDPVSFQSKLDSSMKRLSLVAARSGYLLANPAVSMGDVSLERMQVIVSDRANALYTGYLQQGMSEREARQQAISEAANQFGIGNAPAN